VAVAVAVAIGRVLEWERGNRGGGTCRCEAGGRNGLRLATAGRRVVG